MKSIKEIKPTKESQPPPDSQPANNPQPAAETAKFDAARVLQAVGGIFGLILIGWLILQWVS